MLVTACFPMAREQAAGVADYGVRQSPQDCILAVEGKVAFALKNPAAVRWRHGVACSRGVWPSVPGRLLPTLYGYVQEGDVAIRETYEFDFVYRRYRALVRDGQVIRYCVTDAVGYCMPRS